MAPRKDTVGQTAIVEPTDHPHCAPILHLFPHIPYRPESPGGPETPRLLWTVAEQTGRFSPGIMTTYPSIMTFSQRAKGLNFNCSTKGYFSGLQVLVQCEYIERGQECKCIDAVPRRPCALALCKIPSGFYFAEATALFCVTRECLGD